MERAFSRAPHNFRWESKGELLSFTQIKNINLTL
jgi:hypothetical protein